MNALHAFLPLRLSLTRAVHLYGFRPVDSHTLQRMSKIQQMAHQATWSGQAGPNPGASVGGVQGGP